MKKTLIALALAALPVASMADVVLYGQIKGGVEVTKDKDISGTVTNIVDYGSRIGFKGQEQLNGNLKAIWQLEQKVDIAGGATGKNGANGFGTRNSFVGLSGDFGTVKAGYFDTPVKALNGKLDEWEYSSAAAGLGVFTRGNDAVKRAIAVQYETPNFAGFSGRVYVSPSDNNTAAHQTVNGETTAKVEDKATYGLGFSYEQENGFFADVAGTYVHIGADGQREGFNALAQAGYQNDKWLAGLAYQHSRNVDDLTKYAGNFVPDADSGLGSISRLHEVAGTVAYNVDDALRLKTSLAYGWGLKARESANVPAEKLENGYDRYYQGIVGADYALSKRTVTNAQIGYLQTGKGEDKVARGVVSVGLSHRF